MRRRAPITSAAAMPASHAASGGAPLLGRGGFHRADTGGRPPRPGPGWPPPMWREDPLPEVREARSRPARRGARFGRAGAAPRSERHCSQDARCASTSARATSFERAVDVIGEEFVWMAVIVRGCSLRRSRDREHIARTPSSTRPERDATTVAARLHGSDRELQDGAATSSRGNPASSWRTSTTRKSSGTRREGPPGCRGSLTPRVRRSRTPRMRTAAPDPRSRTDPRGGSRRAGATTQEVVRRVDGHAMHPGRERGVPSEGAELAERGQERVLCHVPRVLLPPGSCAARCCTRGARVCGPVPRRRRCHPSLICARAPRPTWRIQPRVPTTSTSLTSAR